MKHISRLMALLLAAAMILSLATGALASNVDPVDSSVTAVEATDSSTAPEENSSDAVPDEKPAAVPEEKSVAAPEENPAAVPEETETVSEEPAEVEEEILGTEGIANSWRFRNGELLPEDEIEDFSTPRTYRSIATFAATPPVTAEGIDVSHHQGTINWASVAKSKKVDYAIIRCGFGTDSSSNDDRQWLNNVKGCLANNIPFGVYLYSYGCGAKSEANHVLRLLSSAGLTPADLDFPVYIDMEDDSLVERKSEVYMDNGQMLTYVKTWCDAIAAAGYKPGVYANTYWWTTYMSPAGYNQWDRWVARYNSILNYSGKYSMWQYTSTGKVSGIKGAVDMNHYYDTFPTNLAKQTPTVSADNVSNGIKVTWTKVANASSYTVYRRLKGSSSWETLSTAKASTLTYTDTNLTAGKTYEYGISAIVEGTTGRISTAAPLVYLTVPKVSVANSTTGQKVSWKKISGAGGYYVYRKTAGTSWKKIATIKKASTTSYTATGLSSGTTYYYTVRAYNGTSRSAYKSSDALLYLATPKVSVSSVSNGHKVSWNKISGATGYQVYVKTSGSSWKKIATIKKASTTSYTATGLSSGTTYYYTVRAYKGASTSGYKSSSKALYLATPKVSVSNTTNGQKVTWKKISGATGYYVYVKTSGSWKKIATIKSGSSTSYTYTKTKKKTSYYYTVRAVKGSVLSQYKSSSKLAYKPSSLSIPKVSVSSVSGGQKVTWNKISGASGYYIYRKPSGKSWSKIATIKKASTTSYTATKLKNGTAYYYTVRAYKGSAISGFKSSAKTFYKAKK